MLLPIFWIYASLTLWYTETKGPFKNSMQVVDWEADGDLDVIVMKCRAGLRGPDGDFPDTGIGRGMGFRDSNQDLLGFVHMAPDRARARLLDLAATQLENGGAYHQYQPLTKRGNDAVGGGFNDDPSWLVLGVAAYLRETGDASILDELVPFEVPSDPGRTSQPRPMRKVSSEPSPGAPDVTPLHARPRISAGAWTRAVPT